MKKSRLGREIGGVGSSIPAKATTNRILMDEVAAGVRSEERLSQVSDYFVADVDHNSIAVLVVEDDIVLCRSSALTVRSAGFRVETAVNAREARKILDERDIQIVFLDLNLPDEDGFNLLEQVRLFDPLIGVIVVTGSSTVESAIRAMKAGADDYLTKPYSVGQMLETLFQVARKARIAQQHQAEFNAYSSSDCPIQIAGQSAAMVKLRRMMSTVAIARHPALISDEECLSARFVAELIHSSGPFREEPFICIDCGLQSNVGLRQYLFGKDDAENPPDGIDRAGCLTSVGNGTILLHDIGAMPLDLQKELTFALLRSRSELVAPDKGENRPRARVLGSCASDLMPLVRRGRFRADLFSLLNIAHLRIPALRERPEDIIMLSHRLIEKARWHGKERFSLDLSIQDALLAYSWPGGIVELESVLQCACRVAARPELTAADLPSWMLFALEPAIEPANKGSTSLAHRDDESFDIVPIADMERDAILQTIQRVGGDKLLAARMLGIAKTTIYRKLKEYGVVD